MLPASLFSAFAEFGRLTVMPISFTNTAVMMKKMSRFMTKSSIGARSMPVVVARVPGLRERSVAVVAWLVSELVGQALGFEANLRLK